MKLIVAGSGSSGNSYILKTEDEYLILDSGLSVTKVIKPLLNFEISKVSGVLISHEHKDHDGYSKDWIKMGIPTIRPFKNSFIPQLKNNSCFKVQYFPLQDLQGNWVHTNGDGSECPNYGFLITHPSLGNMVYCTDTEFIKWRFAGINHFLIEANYDLEELENDGETKNRHVFQGHHSIQAACKFIQANLSSDLKTVTLCHLSSQNGSPEKFKEMIQKVVGDNVNVYIAQKGLEIDL